MIAPEQSRPLVMKLGGAALDDPATTSDLWRAIAECHRALNGRLILVHGGGVLVDRHLERLGMTTERREGIRITPRNQVEEITAVLAGRVNKSIVAALSPVGVRAVGLFLGDGGIASARRATHYSFDPGYVGTMTGGDPALLTILMDSKFLPVLCSIGMSNDGSLLNLNADDAAAGIAKLLHARGMVFLTDVTGILDAAKSPLASVTPRDIETLVGQRVITGGMIPKANAAARAAAATGIPAVIASFKQPADLVRLARGEPVGTTVRP